MTEVSALDPAHAEAAAAIAATSHAHASSDPGVQAMVTPLVLRHGRKRLSREEFKRGERWKARLPIVVHRGRTQDD